MFKKGEPRPANAGRKKGSKNKAKVARVADYLSEHEINPAQEIIDLIPSLEPREQVNAWLDLLSYCQAKPKPAEDDDGKEPDDELEEVTNADLLKIVKDTNGAS